MTLPLQIRRLQNRCPRQMGRPTDFAMAKPSDVPKNTARKWLPCESSHLRQPNSTESPLSESSVKDPQHDFPQTRNPRSVDGLACISSQKASDWVCGQLYRSVWYSVPIQRVAPELATLCMGTEYERAIIFILMPYPKFTDFY